jgi:hypothetical protein
MENVEKNFIDNVMNIINETETNVVNETETTTNAMTLGIGFHDFRGKNATTKDVIQQIGANFDVEAQKLVRLPQEIIESIINGDMVSINPNWIIDTHKATVATNFDKTIGVVGDSYGVIQNNSCFDLLDLMCSEDLHGERMEIVSAGMVNTFEPYIQAELPKIGRINGDSSETKFYVFAHTSHDGSSGLQLRFSPVRVICRNTFMANVSSKLGVTFKHSKYVGERIDFTKQHNLVAIQDKLRKLNCLCDEYIQQMNAFAVSKVTTDDINSFITNLFIDDEQIKNIAKQYNYNFDNIDDLSTRTKNLIKDFQNTLYSDALGQSDAMGTKLWLFNGTTNYLSNTASYGNIKKDDSKIIAEKRFNSMLNGMANKRVNKAIELLTA